MALFLVYLFVFASSTCFPLAFFFFNDTATTEIYTLSLPDALPLTYGRTLRQLALPIMTIAFILGIAAVMNFSGMTSTLALLMASAGGFFPFFSAVIGALGVFLTGSDTASNTLFGPMQAITAKQIVIGWHPLYSLLTA